MCTCQVGCRRASGALVDRPPLAAAVLTRRDGANVVLSRNPLLLFSSSLFLPCSLERVPTRFSMCTPCQSDRYARQLVKQPSYQRMVRRIFQREGAAAGAKRGRGKRRSFPPRRGKGEWRRERDGPVAVGAIRCLEPRVVGNHLLGVKNSKLRVDMGLCLHRLQPTTGLRGTDVPVIPVALSLYIYISRFSPVARV